jgi:RecA-family ATPase
MPLYNAEDLLKLDIKVEYLVPPFLTKGGTMLLAAPLKSMKTFWTLNMACAIANGKPFIDMPTRQADVLYVDFEIGTAEAIKRLTPMKRHFGSLKNLMVRTADEKPISLDPGTIATSNLFEMLDEVRPGVLILDTLRMSTQGDENSSTDMMKAFMRLRDLRIKFGLTAVVVHHMGKEPDERSTTPRTSRGSSVIEDSPDTIGYLTKHATDSHEPPKVSIRWKFRNHAPIADDHFTFHPDSGLFNRTVKKGKHEPAKVSAPPEKLDITDGLLRSVLN